MMDLFGMGNLMTYAERAVARHESGNLIVDTTGITDGVQPFETAVMHPAYNKGDWVVVEAYPSKEAAQEGHSRWVQIMTAETLPEKLVDVMNSAGVNTLAEIMGIEPDTEFPYTVEGESGEVKLLGDGQEG